METHLESLGPFRWQPSLAPGWTLRDTSGKRVSLESYTKAGKPVLLIFYLGSGCAQCMEQLNLFAPVANEFKEAGITLLAVGTENKSGLKLTGANSKDHAGFPFPLLSDYDMRVFKSYRAYDDFEKMPLHGTFLIDGKERSAGRTSATSRSRRRDSCSKRRSGFSSKTRLLPLRRANTP